DDQQQSRADRKPDLRRPDRSNLGAATRMKRKTAPHTAPRKRSEPKSRIERERGAGSGRAVIHRSSGFGGPGSSDKCGRWTSSFVWSARVTAEARRRKT